MPDSLQEEFVKTLLDRSLGAPFIFEPDDYRLGAHRQKVREAADLVWWCRDTAILMYMTAPSRATAEKADEHNFADARRWLRHWQQGQVLTGSNSFTTVSYPIKDVKNIVALSVIRVPEPHAWGRRERSEVVPDAFVKASLPESVLQRLAETAGSAADLARLLSKLAHHGEPVGELQALAWLNDECTKQRADAWASPKVSPTRDEALDHQIGITLIEALRESSPTTLKPSPTASDTYDSLAIFNDLDWHASVTLVARTADTIRQVRDVPVGSYGPQYLGAEVEVAPYLFLVLVADQRQAGKATEQIGPHLQQLTLERPSYPPNLLTYMLVGRPQGSVGLMLAMSPQTGRTVTARLLQEIDYPPS